MHPGSSVLPEVLWSHSQGVHIQEKLSGQGISKWSGQIQRILQLVREIWKGLRTSEKSQVI